MKKIMIVDDNYLSAEGIEKNIDWEALNAEIVHICYNGTSAIEAMKKESVDLIISDIEMPDLDGISMSRQAGLRLSDPESKKRFCPDGTRTEKSPASETEPSSAY